MDGQALEEFFALQWGIITRQGKNDLEPYDQDEMNHLSSWDAIQNLLIHPSSNEIALVKPAMSHLKTFVEFFQTNLGPGLNAAAMWGALGVLIQASSESPRATRTMQRVIKSIGYKADSFNACVAAMPVVSRQVKETCFDIQIQLFKFFIDAIRVLRGDHDEGAYGTRRSEFDDPLTLIEKRFLNLNTDLNENLARIEKIVQFTQPIPIRDLVKESSEPKSSQQQQPLFILPKTTTPPGRFFDRVDIFEKLQEYFKDPETPMVLKAVALWGMGGIGKSSISMTYVNMMVQKRRYDAMFWIHAEKPASLRQSFTEIAIKLKLPNASSGSHDENLEAVQEWFQFTECRWLVIYDNAFLGDTLRPYWPSSSRGHAIITTRNPSLAFDFTATNIEVKSWDIETGSDFLLFLLKKEIGDDIGSEGLSAYELSKRLSGHALGLAHMAGLIHRRSWSITEFMNLYLKDPRRVHASELQALWEFSFRSLEPEAHQLLGIFAFLMPDEIPQRIFQIDEHQLPERLQFCSDEFSFWEAVETLLTLSLIKRNKQSQVFSTHRMVQAQFKYHLDSLALNQTFDDAVKLIYTAFPKQDEEKGTLYEKWSECNTYLQHAIYLKDSYKECHKIDSSFCATVEFCMLLVECQRYLFEANLLDDLEDMCQVNLIAAKSLQSPRDATDITASTYSHLAQMYESLGHADKAVKLNQEGLELRLQEEPLNLHLISGFENNLGCAYDTANDHDNALVALKRSLDTWNRAMTDEGKSIYPEPIITNNLARCYFYLGKLTEARKNATLAIEEIQKTQPVSWGVLATAHFVLGMIDRQEGNLDAAEARFIEAQNIWLLGDHTRRHPFNGACLYKMGICCLEQGKTEAAVKHFRDSIEITRLSKEKLPSEHGRNLFKLSEALIQDKPDNSEAAEDLYKDSNIYLRQGSSGAPDATSEAAFNAKINICWR